MLSLQKVVGSESLEDVLDPAQVNPQFIVYNMTKVNKHGVVSLEDKTGRPDMCLFSLWRTSYFYIVYFVLFQSPSIDDLPHWVLSAMKCLANCKLLYL